MNLLRRMDRAQLAAADAVVACAWDVLGTPRRMLLRMALVGQFLTQAAAEFVDEGRVELLTLLTGALVMGLYHLNDLRFGANPALQRAFTLARRRTPVAAFVRFLAWIIAAYDLATALPSRAAPLDVASAVFFLAFMLGGDSLTPKDPRKPRRRRAHAGRGARAALPVGVRGR